MLRRGNQALFAARVAAPEQEHNRPFMLVKLLDDVIGKGCPTDVPMAVGLSAPYGQGGVEQQHAALGPFGQRAARRRRDAEIAL